MGLRPRTRRGGRRAMAALALAILPMMAGASARSTNFTVEAPSTEVARQVASYAEHYRRVVARQWIGEELPDWPRPCAVRIKITGGEAGGVTSFGFARGKVVDQEMSLEGRIDRILASALPHEVTHTIFAAYFGGPLPRWADEGASLLSEDRRERLRHERFASDLLTRSGGWRLPDLFSIEEYPSDLMGFYGQGYSVSRFLVEMGGRPRFLAFLRDGMAGGWDAATKAHYGFSNAKELDRAWRSWHSVASHDLPRDDSHGDRLVVRAQSPEGADTR
ncbi:gluzincin family metallopeptidase [Tautonia plasticadhaerens]|uniref:Peptidase MA-like domain-containing protein n=1 Tax=Tautonia plasticadhaerens TaxID=2527974 RepID=A0A518HAN0_9BACT|nr:hypothetical protein [Tautonia plasticadhaerens]QDV37816.1 hypothetical protein ElP_57630 [Tautonia plasticadhaerens]